MEKEMATHASILAWRIQWTEVERGVPNTVHGVTNSQTQLGDYHSLTYINIHVYRYIYIYILLKIFFSAVVYYRILTMLPWAIQQEGVMYLLYIQ